MISVTYFALENIAMSKGNVHQDQSDQHEDGQGKVRSVMLYFNLFSQRLFNNCHELLFTISLRRSTKLF